MLTNISWRAFQCTPYSVLCFHLVLVDSVVESGNNLAEYLLGDPSPSPESTHTIVTEEKASDGCKEIPGRGGRNNGQCLVYLFFCDVFTGSNVKKTGEWM